jgi:hypothetical protein
MRSHVAKHMRSIVRAFAVPFPRATPPKRLHDGDDAPSRWPHRTYRTTRTRTPCHCTCRLYLVRCTPCEACLPASLCGPTAGNFLSIFLFCGCLPLPLFPSHGGCSGKYSWPSSRFHWIWDSVGVVGGRWRRAWGRCDLVLWGCLCGINTAFFVCVLHAFFALHGLTWSMFACVLCACAR